MRIEAADYVIAAQERLTNASLLYEAAQYSFALYAAGVAVESLLRAYIVRLNPRFDTAHDLTMLLNASNLRSIAAPAEYEKISAAMSDLLRRWRNDLRYTSNSRLRRYLKRKKLDRGIRGDFLKENCRFAIETAATIIRIGVAKWKQS
ncbi:HEPN domain-containing protein [candidate division KSB1 bacterium]|nr:HEPN domain-containing protein [candidate division KSB1 bacterium]